MKLQKATYIQVSNIGVLSFAKSLRKSVSIWELEQLYKSVRAALAGVKQTILSESFLDIYYLIIFIIV